MLNSVLTLLKRHWLLLLVVSLVYIPFLDVRVIRTTGDEKVYIAQAIEMNSIGNWFVQVLNGQPDYYKGPLHYLLLKVGLLIFGYSLWAAVYMNLIFCLAGAVALAEIVQSVFPGKKHLAFWAGVAFSLNVGVFGHFFASQMEVELAGLFSVAFYFLWKSSKGISKSVSDAKRDELIFWLLAGLAGWLKSPLHSVLLGASALFYWLVSGELLSRLTSLRSLMNAACGVLLCALGYAPAFLLDREHFLKLYIERETLKPANGGPWWQSLVPILSYYLIPWMTLALLSYFEFIYKIIFKRNSESNWNGIEKKLFTFCLSTFAFTTIFFCVYPYRGENYTMPVTGSVILLILFFLKNTSGIALRVRSWILALTSIPLLALPVLLQMISNRFHLPSEIWPSWFMPLVWFFSVLSIGLQLWEYIGLKTDGIGVRATIGTASIMVVLALVIGVFGEMEVAQLKQRIREDRKQGLNYSIYYWNLNRLIWNEWGLMSLAVHEKILPMLTQADLEKAIQSGDLILARDTDRGREMEDFAKNRFPDLKPKYYTWNRWKTHAQDGAGNSLIGKAWAEKDLSILWDHALIMRFER
jgi:4-amino-4-deoxy-L-arabinose transferase-like glycosyltransferase